MLQFELPGKHGPILGHPHARIPMHELLDLRFAQVQPGIFGHFPPKTCAGKRALVKCVTMTPIKDVKTRCSQARNFLHRPVGGGIGWTG